MNEERFKVGDKVTYKSKKDCTFNSGKKGLYYYNGEEQDGYVGTIKRYVNYIKEKDCWVIDVTVDGGEYAMLECEFLEYDMAKTNDMFPIY